MNKIKYLAAVLIAVAGMGLQQVQAHLSPGQQFSASIPGGGEAELAYLIANNYLAADCQFATKWEQGSGFEDPNNPFNQYFTVTETTPGTWTITWDLTGTGLVLGGVLIKDGESNPPESIYSFFDGNHEEVGSGEVSFTGQFEGRDISHISFFVCPRGQVPDGGTTVMLLGAALGSLGMARRFLKK
jgi:VPDSG-CTERM motif